PGGGGREAGEVPVPRAEREALRLLGEPRGQRRQPRLRGRGRTGIRRHDRHGGRGRAGEVSRFLLRTKATAGGTASGATRGPRLPSRGQLTLEAGQEAAGALGAKARAGGEALATDGGRRQRADDESCNQETKDTTHGETPFRGRNGVVRRLANRLADC